MDVLNDLAACEQLPWRGEKLIGRPMREQMEEFGRVANLNVARLAQLQADVDRLKACCAAFAIGV